MAKKKSIKELISESANPFVTDKWAEWSVSHLKPQHLVSRFDDKLGNRFYFFNQDKEVIIAAGITTIIDKVLPNEETRRLNKWKEDNPNWRHLLNISSEYGTLEHAVHGDIMFKKGVDNTKLDTMQKIVSDYGGSHNMPSKDVLAFLKFQEDYNLRPLLIEAQLVYRDPITGEWVAMTIDLLAQMSVPVKTKTQVEDGVYQRGENKGKPRFKDVVTETIIEKILIVDFKGNFFDKDSKGFFLSNKIQLQAAKLAVEQNFSDIKVDDVYNYAPNNWKTEPSYTLHKWDLTDLDWKKFNNHMETAFLYGYNRPQKKMLVTEGFKDSSDFKFLTYKEYVEQVLLNPK
jgi:hypothetical protein